MRAVISFINMKGGVGKTTISSTVAGFLAEEFNKRVLLIDIDPQTNATLFFIDEETWKEKEERGETIVTLFKDYINRTNFFDFDKTIIKDIKRRRDAYRGIDLLPSSPELGLIQERLTGFISHNEGRGDPELIMKNKLNERIKRYEFVLIDAPPNIGIITRNALRMSDYYIIPVIPDYLSTFGIDELVSELKNTYRMDIPCLGIIISKYRSNVSTHKKYYQILKAKANDPGGIYVFNTAIRETVRLEDVPELKNYYNRYTPGQLYGYGELREDIRELTHEIIKKVEEYEQ